MGEPRLDQTALTLVGHVALDRLAKLPPGRLRGLVFGDARTGANHLGERPVGHAFPVRERAALMPVDLRLDAVDVLEELPEQP